MFRVLSDEEAEKAIRWKAPDLPGRAANIGSTREWVRPINPLEEKSLAANKQKQNVTPGRGSERLQTAASGMAVNTMSSTSTSVEMLQSSYDDGYAKGYSDADAELQKQSVQALDTLISSMSSTVSMAYEPTLHAELLGLCMDIARLLIHREITIDPAVMIELIQAGVEQLPALNNSAKKIHLHPLDAAVVREIMTPSEGVVVVDDSMLKRGQCRIEAGGSTIRSGVDDWLYGMARDLGILPDEVEPDLHFPEEDN